MNDALTIWQAAVDAVRSDELVRRHVQVDPTTLTICGQEIPLASLARIRVVGAGKAGAGMVRGLEAALGEELLSTKQVTGWVNVPEDCLADTHVVHLHGARPAGVNEPTRAGVIGTEKIIDLVASADEKDLCIALISGGGSALLPAPIAGFRLEQKQAITRFLSAAGANIEQLNTVRKQLSRIKGEGLARACNAGRLITLIISDVMGDPLDIIASGPTVPNSTSPEDALHVLRHFGAETSDVGADVIKRIAALNTADTTTRHVRTVVSNHIIGSNAVAVQAAVARARELGYSTEHQVAQQSEGLADDVGREFFARAVQMRSQSGKHCLVSGGEPTVKLAAADRRGLGGRNQQLVLAALAAAFADPSADPVEVLAGITLLSGGTDGEDGPTDAAGAWMDRDTAARTRSVGLDIDAYLRTNDAYHFFAQVGGLMRTGPTHTNVCDVRVVVTDSPDPNSLV